jgi:serine/threonine protein kinase HipA of HipAB toxin-antitoxin module
MPSYHLAQINVARAKDHMDSLTMRDFVTRLDDINHLAEHSPGFVWRLKGDGDNATSIRAFDDPLLLVNLSVWTDLENLKAFVYRTTHAQLLRERHRWFHPTQVAHQALWWIPAGHTPTLHEAKLKLAQIECHGPTAEAFSFAHYFLAPGSESVSAKQ